MIVALDAQEKSVKKAVDSLREIENSLFQADKKLHLLVNSLEDAELVIEQQKLLDQER